MSVPLTAPTGCPPRRSPPPPAAQPPAPTPAGCCGTEPPVPSAPLRSVPLLPPRSAPPGPAASRPAAPRCGKWRRGRRPVGAPGWGLGGRGGGLPAKRWGVRQPLPSPPPVGRASRRGSCGGAGLSVGLLCHPFGGQSLGIKAGFPRLIPERKESCEGEMRPPAPWSPVSCLPHFQLSSFL